jgi:hypothetical protein
MVRSWSGTTAPPSCGRLASGSRRKSSWGEIEFEVLRFDEVFKSYQVPSARSRRPRGLTFHPTIVTNDTSSGNDDPID